MEEQKNQALRTLSKELGGVVNSLQGSNSSTFITQAEELTKLQNLMVTKASEITGQDFSHYSVTLSNTIKRDEFRAKVHGLLGAVNSFLPDVVVPSNGYQSPVNQTTITISNQVQLQIATDIGVKIGELLASNTTPEEKTFLTKLKEALPLAKGVLDIISTTLILAHTYGITIERLKIMFGH